MDMAGGLGSIATRMAAETIAADGNLLEDITVLRDVRFALKDGVEHRDN